ncbi:MAG: protein translocase subunit SecD [Acidimicrobiales bacterium]
MRRGPGLTLALTVLVAVAAVGGTLAAGNRPQLGLDLQGGASVVLRPKKEVSSGALDQAIEIIRNRVDALGVVEPDISRQGDNIIVQLPGVRDQARALDLVGQTAELRFRPVVSALGDPDSVATTTTTAPGGPSETTEPTVAPGATPETTAAANSATLRLPQTDTTAPEPTAATSAPADPATTTAPPADPSGTTTPPTTVPAGDVQTTPRDQDLPDQQVVLDEVVGGEVRNRYLLGPTELTGTAVRTARAEFDPTQGWRVNFTLTGEGSKAFDELAARNLQRQVAIVLDGVVKSAPVIQEAQFGGTGVISGNFTEREAKDLALVLRYGALPVELEPETVQTVSASLGKDSLTAGIAAGLVGLALVLVYMILYYRALGLVVILGLGVWAALMWSVISLLGETSGLALSLAGAVGIIISVGVTVDSYVVYFERLKDEVRAGKTIRSSVDRGFSRAFRTILTADVASFMGAALLYLLTVGSVRGFAFFLGLSTVLDVVVAYFFTRPLVILLGRNRVFTEARWLGVARGLAAAPARGA